MTTTKLTVGAKVEGIFLARGSREVAITGTVVQFWNGGVEVTFDAPVEYAPGLDLRTGAWYPDHHRWMLRAA